MSLIQTLITSYRQMKSEGILGMNCRNGRYISRYNDRSLYPLVDDKLLTKQLALRHDLKVPDLFGVVRYQHEIDDLEKLIAGKNGFCLKPSKGSGGKGILVILDTRDGVDGPEFKKTNNEWVDLSFLRRHAGNIIAGLYSLGGAIDKVLIEKLIVLDPYFDDFSYAGIPDIRVIVFCGMPVMAMMRLSTSASDGKANLHQGAVGVGIDMASGTALRAVQKDEVITHHPDTEVDLTTLEVPHWDRLLRLACRCADITGLGYIGVDLVLDREQGPLVLELNARPGLSIQVANGRGLKGILEKVEGLEGLNRYSIDERISYQSQL